MTTFIFWLVFLLVIFGVIWCVGPDTDDTDSDKWGYL